MKDGIMVSVTCVTYNHKDYIRDMIEGVLSQKTQYKYELIIHDDASSDGTTEIIKEYADKYPDIIVPLYETENQYLKGTDVGSLFLPYIRGRFVANCDGDDYWIDPYKIQKQVDYLLDHPRIIGCCTNMAVWDYVLENPHVLERCDNSMVVDHYSNLKKREKKETWCKWKSDHYVSVRHMNGQPIIKPSSWMIRSTPYIADADIISDLGGFIDLPIQMWMISQSNVFYMSDVTAVYRMNLPGSWSYKLLFGDSESRKNELKSESDIWDKFNEITEYKYDKLIRKRQNRYIYRNLNNAREMELLATIGHIRIAKAGCYDIAIATFIYKYIPWIYKGIRIMWRHIIGENDALHD